MESVQRPRPNWREWRPALRSMAESGVPLRESLDLFATAYVRAALELTKGNQVQAGKLIQTHRNTIRRWLKRP